MSARRVTVLYAFLVLQSVARSEPTKTHFEESDQSSESQPFQQQQSPIGQPTQHQQGQSTLQQQDQRAQHQLPASQPTLHEQDQEALHQQQQLPASQPTLHEQDQEALHQQQQLPASQPTLQQQDQQALYQLPVSLPTPNQQQDPQALHQHQFPANQPTPHQQQHQLPANLPTSHQHQDPALHQQDQSPASLPTLPPDQTLVSPPPNQQTPISLPTLYQEWRNQSTRMVAWQLGLMFIVAGDGDDFYYLHPELSSHHQRVARVAFQMLLQLPTQAQTEALLNQALATTAANLSSSSQLRHPLEVLLDLVDQQLRVHPHLGSPYEHLLATTPPTVVPGNRKRYFDRVFNIEAGYFPMEPNYMTIPGNMKVLLQTGFRKKLQDTAADNHYYYVLANAIYNLARKDEYRQRIEQIREKVTAEVLPIMRKVRMVPFFFEADPFVNKMLQKFERSVNEQPDLRRELHRETLEIERRTRAEGGVADSSGEFSYVTISKNNITT